jgi:hypothetical protein
MVGMGFEGVEVHHFLLSERDAELSVLLGYIRLEGRHCLEDGVSVFTLWTVR